MSRLYLSVENEVSAQRRARCNGHAKKVGKREADRIVVSLEDKARIAAKIL